MKLLATRNQPRETQRTKKSVSLFSIVRWRVESLINDYKDEAAQ